jgi:hypothetical protein
MGPQTYSGTSNSVTQVTNPNFPSPWQESLPASQLPAGNYTIQITVKFQTLKNNQIGGQWQSAASAHKFDLFGTN